MDTNIEAIIAKAVERTVGHMQRKLSDGAQVQRTWLKTSEAAEYLGCDPDYLEKLRRQGGGPRFHQRAARLVRYRVSDLDAWMVAGQGGE